METIKTKIESKHKADGTYNCQRREKYTWGSTGGLSIAVFGVEFREVINLKMEAVRPSETLVTTYKIVRCHNPGDHNRQSHRRENLTSDIPVYHKLFFKLFGLFSRAAGVKPLHSSDKLSHVCLHIIHSGPCSLVTNRPRLNTFHGNIL